jgi:hypothetical protein
LKLLCGYGACHELSGRGHRDLFYLWHRDGPLADGREPCIFTGILFRRIACGASRNYVANMFTSIAMDKALQLRALARCGGYDGHVSVRATLAAQLVPDPGEEAVSPYVWSRGFKQIDVVAIQRSRRRHRISRAISSSK